jgi:hypothetical protein
MPTRHASAAVLLLLAAACGPGLDGRAQHAMEGCVAQRNPLFVAGKGAEAVALPLPEAVEREGRMLGYDPAYKKFVGIAQQARTQAILTCALEFGARSPSAEAKAFVMQYLKHPDAAVALKAKLLLEKYHPDALVPPPAVPDRLGAQPLPTPSAP